MALNWEYLGKEELPPGGFAPWTIETWRTPVPGGWLVLTMRELGNNPALSTTFVPDETHAWDGNSLPHRVWDNET